MANHREVVDEYKRAQLPVNYERKREWANQKIEKEEQKEKAKTEGVDYERQRFLDMQADEADRWDKTQRDKYNPDTGFTSYEASTARQHNRFASDNYPFDLKLILNPVLLSSLHQSTDPTTHRLVKQIKPDFEKYMDMKEELKEAFYPTKDTIVQGLHKDSKVAIDRMVDDLKTQVDKRHKFSRRRKFNDDEDIDYINEKNMRFNKNLERFYGQYTKETKRNFERGTAV